MVSFDIKSLFTNVPVDEALEVILQRLTEDETLEDRTALTPEQITHLLELCLKTTYFSFREEFFQQTDGAAMGSPVSPVVANLYMEMFEEMALSTTEPRPRVWRRYVDDIFCLVEEKHMDNLLKHLNNQRPTIRFTVEREDSNSSLPFLDTLLTRRQDGGLNIAVYRKPSHTDRYLQFSSHHPAHVRRGVASCLFRRARTIPTGDNVRLEEEHLRRVLKDNMAFRLT